MKERGVHSALLHLDMWACYWLPWTLSLKGSGGEGIGRGEGRVGGEGTEGSGEEGRREA